MRHCSRLFVTAAGLRVPFVSVILRKAYGLGAQAMAAGSLHEPLLTVGWPTAGWGRWAWRAVRLGLRRELEAIALIPTSASNRFEERPTRRTRTRRRSRRHPVRARRRDRSGRDTGMIIGTLAAAGSAGGAEATPRRFVDTW